MATSFGDLLGQLDFWRGAGRLLLIVLLIAVMFMLTMAYSGNPVHIGSRRRADGRRRGAAESPGYVETTGGTTGVEGGDEAGAHPAAAPEGRLAHLDLLATLRTSLRYQGSTVALVVISVLILAIDHVLSSAEVATILSGITGYVLGSQRSTNEVSTAPPPKTGEAAGVGDGSTT